MPWNEQWSYVVDGTDVNDKTLYFCEIPEIDNLQGQDLILAPIAGDYPAFIRSQPSEGRLTFNIAMKGAGTAALFRTRIDALKALFSQGTQHTLVVQARGMAATKTLRFYVEGSMTDYKRRIVSFRAVAHKPVLE